MATTDTNMLDYIGDKMDALDFDGDVNLNWDKEAHVIELEYIITVATNQDFQIEDQEGETAADGSVSYEDAVLFFDQTRMNGADYADQYLTVIPFNGKKGISQASVDAFFDYFQQVLDDGESDMLDFVDGTSDEDQFEVKFDEDEYARLVSAQPEEKAKVFYGYPKY